MTTAQHFSKDLYKLLHLPRTATTPEIKQSYRRIALALHPDRHNGCPTKSDEFKAVTEAYRILIDYGKRVEYDKWLSSVRFEGDKIVKKGVSRAAERNPFYRKVYSPQAPPGMKTFDRQRHYDMHYGDGIMREEIERARKRAEMASSRRSGSSYQSPLGNGFTFDKGRPVGDQVNPYSRRGRRQNDHVNEHNNNNGGMKIEYEEAYLDMSGANFDHARRVMKSKEYVVERMNDRRRNRVRERGEPLEKNAESSGCIIM